MNDAKTILCFSGHDPSGGAGIQADIEAIAAQDCHAVTIITCLTVQDSNNLMRLEPVDSSLIKKQAQLLLQDIPIDVVKIGMLGSAPVARAIGQILATLPPTPVVLDPVLRSGGGSKTADKQLIDTIISQILPYTTLATPNQYEARQLADRKQLADCAKWLQEQGCDAVLITGTDGTTGESIQHQLYSNRSMRALNGPRLAGNYHGSGCTLAASIAARLALGDTTPEAVKRAQEYTLSTLQAARRIGNGQKIPHRILQ